MKGKNWVYNLYIYIKVYTYSYLTFGNLKGKLGEGETETQIS